LTKAIRPDKSSRGSPISIIIWKASKKPLSGVFGEEKNNTFSISKTFHRQIVEFRNRKTK
jgi:hypothetical protein